MLYREPVFWVMLHCSNDAACTGKVHLNEKATTLQLKTFLTVLTVGTIKLPACFVYCLSSQNKSGGDDISKLDASNT